MSGPDLAYAKERVAVESPRNGPVVLARLAELELENEDKSWAPIALHLDQLAGRWLSIPRDVYDAIGVLVPALRALEIRRVAEEQLALEEKAQHSLDASCWCKPVIEGNVAKHVGNGYHQTGRGIVEVA